MTTAEIISALVNEQLSDEAVAILKVLSSTAKGKDFERSGKNFYGGKQTVDEVNEFAQRFAAMFR